MTAAEMTRKLTAARNLIAAMQQEQHVTYENLGEDGDWATRSYHQGLALGLRSALQVLDSEFPAAGQ